MDSTETEAVIVFDSVNGGFKIFSRGSDNYRRLTDSLRDRDRGPLAPPPRGEAAVDRDKGNNSRDGGRQS